MLFLKLLLLPAPQRRRVGAAARPFGGGAGSTGVPFACKARLESNLKILRATRMLSDPLFAPKWCPRAPKRAPFEWLLVTVGRSGALVKNLCFTKGIQGFSGFGGVPKPTKFHRFSGTRSERLRELTFARFGTVLVPLWGCIGSPMGAKCAPKSTQSR